MQIDRYLSWLSTLLHTHTHAHSLTRSLTQNGDTWRCCSCVSWFCVAIAVAAAVANRRPTPTSSKLYLNWRKLFWPAAAAALTHIHIHIYVYTSTSTYVVGNFLLIAKMAGLIYVCDRYKTAGGCEHISQFVCVCVCVEPCWTGWSKNGQCSVTLLLANCAATATVAVRLPAIKLLLLHAMPSHNSSSSKKQLKLNACQVLSIWLLLPCWCLVYTTIYFI